MVQDKRFDIPLSSEWFVLPWFERQRTYQPHITQQHRVQLFKLFLT